MRALTRAVVEPGGVLGQYTCQPPLTLRQVRSDDPDVCALCLVGTAAGPLAGDELTLELLVTAGARATLQAAGASLAQGRGDGAGALHTRVRLGADAHLDARPGAVVVGAGGRVDVSVELELGTGSGITWRETVVLGRSDEAAGAATLRWDVTRGGRPVLRQFIDLTDPELSAWPGLLSGGRVIATALLSGPGVMAQTLVADDTAAAVALDPQTLLVTVLGSDAAEVGRRLDVLLTRTAPARTAPVTVQ
ncbi:urease accessory protein UreD [Jatrophihabitans sp.]|uniref:urease accessory protein UreD n=1 Tax=Jatrophihabitans sp. TaxID=1932789 RepID=UPI0030C67FCA|nr:Urease accessory protein UreD [Jatrophihabitans sp.]